MTFQRLLFAERRTTGQTIGLLAFLCIPLTLGVWVRLIVPNFYAADIAFETVIILGILLGPFSALLGGAVLSLPAMLHHEYLTLPFFLAVAVVSGLYGRAVEPEEVWSFSPFVDLSIYRWVRRNLRKPRFDRQVLLLMLIVGHADGPHVAGAGFIRGGCLRLDSPSLAVKVCDLGLRRGGGRHSAEDLEREPHRDQAEGAEAAGAGGALRRPAAPDQSPFLFNTLNSIASLVRFRPEMAREMIVQLGNILRALLKDHDSYVPLREELSFTDDYLGIEVVRFGAEKLRVVKEIDPDDAGTAGAQHAAAAADREQHQAWPGAAHAGRNHHPAQPHPGRQAWWSRWKTTAWAWPRAARAEVGFVSRGAGIGMRNVRERLEVLYGEQRALRSDQPSGAGNARHPGDPRWRRNVLVLADQTSARASTLS